MCVTSADGREPVSAQCPSRLRKNSTIASYVAFRTRAVSRQNRPQDAQKGRPARPQRTKRRIVLVPYGEPLSDARTPLADFFRILLEANGSFLPARPEPAETGSCLMLVRYASDRSGHDAGRLSQQPTTSRRRSGPPRSDARRPGAPGRPDTARSRRCRTDRFFRCVPALPPRHRPDRLRRRRDRSRSL